MGFEEDRNGVGTELVWNWNDTSIRFELRELQFIGVPYYGMAFD